VCTCKHNVYILLHNKYDMARKVTAVAGGKVKIEDNVEEIFEKVITPYGNGAKIDSQKKFIGKRAIVLILKD